MQDPLTTSLVVTGIGMLALFLALALLCGLMYLMTALIKDRPPATASEEKEKQPRPEDALRAALIAVALARAEVEMRAASAPPAHKATSAWRTLHHQRQLTRNPAPRRTR
jgi:Na+-transporting methylmalonyl-CoA/oxaloacetate decarboxylase gamma subunit